MCVLFSFYLLRPSLYLSWVGADHAHNVLPVMHPSAVVSLVSRNTGVVAHMIALATPQTEVHVTDAPPELCVPSTVTPLALLCSAA